MCKNNEQMCKNFYEDGDRSIFFFLIRKEFWNNLSALWFRRLAQQISKSVGTRQPINAVEINAYWFEQDVHKILSIECTRLPRAYRSGPVNSRLAEDWWLMSVRDEMEVRGGVSGKWPGKCSTPWGTCYSLFGDYRWLKFLLYLKFCICIYQYFIIFPQWTILHQKFLRRKKLGSAKREVKTKSGRTREEEVTPFAGGGGRLGAGQVLEMRGPRCGYCRGQGLIRGWWRGWRWRSVRSPHVSWAPGSGGGAMADDSVCQVLF